MYTCSGNMVLSRVSGGMQLFLLFLYLISSYICLRKPARQEGTARHIGNVYRTVKVRMTSQESGIITVSGNDRDYGFSELRPPELKSCI